MKLLTKAILSKLPKLYATEDVAMDDKIVQVKFFNPYGSGTWLITEYDPEERLAFGYCQIQEPEWGYVSLDELESLMFLGRPRIERDIYFTPKKFSECVNEDGWIKV